jgi:hypothetical protein
LVSRSITGIETVGHSGILPLVALLSVAGGGTLLLIALIDKGTPGKIYSRPAIVVSVLCGLLCAGTAFLMSTSFAFDVSFSPAYGLLCVSPLAALLGYFGGSTPVHKEQAAITAA